MQFQCSLRALAQEDLSARQSIIAGGSRPKHVAPSTLLLTCVQPWYVGRLTSIVVIYVVSHMESAATTSGAVAPHRDASHQPATTASRKSNANTTGYKSSSGISSSTPALVAVCLAGASALGLTVWKILRGRKGNNNGSDGKQSKREIQLLCNVVEYLNQ